MKKKFMTIGVALVACFAVLFAAVKTEMRMYVHQKGDAWNTTVNSVDSVKFSDDEVDGKKVQRMHVVRKDGAGTWCAATANVDSVNFQLDTLRYLVTFMDGKTVVAAKKYDYGTMPECEFPVSESARLKTYDFFWNPKLTLVVDDATYTLDSTYIHYKYRFVDYNGEVLKDTVAAYNYEPKVSVLPIITKDSIFTFKEWLRNEDKIADSVIVLAAQYDSTLRKYTCEFYNCDTLFATVKDCAYDSVPKENPTRVSSEVYNYIFKGWTLDESKLEKDTLIYTAEYNSVEHGMLTYASFKISDTKSVYFSKGNLQFNAVQGSHKTADSTAKGTWRFAENQWDVIGADNVKRAEDYDGWIDLFDRGTSGWNSGAKVYQPWATSDNSADYRSDGINKDLTGDNAKADWGVYNAISNGGDTPDMWRTLTIEEWQYLFENNRWTMGKVDTILCFMLVPKEFSAPSGVKVTVISDSLSMTGNHIFSFSEARYEDNTYTAEEFKALEKLGIVSLPCGGARYYLTSYVIKFDGLGRGRYWSTSALLDDNCYYFGFGKSVVQTYSDAINDRGWSLRLVYDLTYDIHFVDADGTTLLDTTVARGTVPVYNGTPALKSKAYTLTFRGWDKERVAAKSDMTYTAVYDSTQVFYTSILKGYDGTTLDTVKNCAYDFVPNTMPTRVLSDEYNYTFRWSVDESGIEENTLVYTAVCDSFLKKKNGAIRAFAYKVSDTDSVYFSQGNLQFNAAQGTHKTADSTAQGTWRFADRQYDCIGNANYSISETYDGWIDLFGWGTSGWNSGATAYQPWATSTSTEHYYLGGGKYNNMTGDYCKADWGVFNAISNGGDEPNRWRTLTNAEWKYLFHNNQWTLGYIKDGTLSYLCFMLIPKTFTAPEGLTVDALSAEPTATVVSGLTVPSGNNYTAEQFEELENLGVVALPCGGDRSNGTATSGFNSYGYYWTSSVDDYTACAFFFRSVYVNLSYSKTRDNGYSVRLVQNVNLNVRFVNADGTTLLDTVVARGATPRYTREDPTMASTKEYEFVFMGWDKDFVAAEDDMVYTAVYDSLKLNINIHFMNADGTTLLDTVVARGATPRYTREDPTMASTKEYKFDFTGWDKDFVAAEDDMTYTAVYDTFPMLYTSIFKNYDGEIFTTIENCAYDSVPKDEPTRASGQYYAYKFLKWQRDESKISENLLVYTAVYAETSLGEVPVGAINAVYKVSDTKEVFFSKGNLQFNAVQGTHAVLGETAEVAGTWRFAENQYDYIGSANNNISETYDGWIDLFGWGTSGWNSGANAYQPWATSTSKSDYCPGNSSSNNLTGDYAKADWGVYNAISNGGNEPNKWRTLTKAEWEYLFQNNKWTLGYIKDGSSSYLCFMLIPSTFAEPEGTTVTVLSTSTSSTNAYVTVPSTNTYTTEQFASLERLGVVAFPCGGYRGGTTMGSVGLDGYYWSSSAYGSGYAYVFYVYFTLVSSNHGNLRSDGGSVRLVQDL